MKNVNLILAAVLFATFALTSCQKEGLQEIESLTEKSTTEQLDIESILSSENLQQATKTEINFSDVDRHAASSRSNGTLVYSATTTVTAGLDVFYWLKSTLPNPSTHKVEVKVTPINGSTDIYLAGSDIDYTFSRLVRSSTLSGQSEDYVTFRQTDLMSTEERMNISVVGTGSYEINIYLSDVECIEYPPAETFPGWVIQTVCTCDETQYSSPDDAWNDGYTSWTNGPCVPEDVRYRNVALGQPTPGFIVINRIEISNNAQFIQFRTPRCLGPNKIACNWEVVPLSYDSSKGKWVAEAERIGDKKQFTIKIEFVRQGEFLLADIEYTAAEKISPNQWISLWQPHQETYRKV